MDGIQTINKYINTIHRISQFSKSTILVLVLILIIACTPVARFSHQHGQRNKSPSDMRTQYNNHSKLWLVAQSWLNVPYKFGGLDKNGVDCSALSRTLLWEAFGIELPRMAKDQMKGGSFVRQPWLEEGDLLFFRDDHGSFQDHVGVFLGNGQFIHASSSQGVIISDLFSTYYQERLIMARRYLD